MKTVREACKPRSEVLKGDLEDAIFAADFGHVIEGRAPRVYQDPKEFFRNTHPAVPLKKVVTTIFERLADPNEAGAAVRLSTGFGGGKTHTLIALWHLAKNISDATLGGELLPAAGRPKNVAVAGADGDKLGTRVCGRHDGLVTHSLWGELAFQFSGQAGYANIKSEDDPETVPDAALLQEILPSDHPVLILLDELVLYMKKLSDQGRDALLGFIGLLISEVRARSQALLVITDPRGQPAFQKEVTALDEAIGQSEAAQKLGDILGRKMSNFDPIGDEAAQVIIRRLLEEVDKAAAEEASAEYFNAYQRVVSEHPDVLPPEAATRDYAQRIVECYPFHPRLLETAQDRLGALQDFNKSRGTLRLFGRILRDIWGNGSEVPVITAGDLDWRSTRIQADLLQRLNRDRFKPAVDADIVRHAGQLDADFSTDVHRRVATALLLESLPLTSSAAMDKRALTLAVLRPSDVGHEAGEAMDRLMSVCWHTYKDDSGLKFQFRYEPNANKIIEERAESILLEDAKQDVLTLVQHYFGGHPFTLVPYPDSPRAVSDSAKLKLVLSDTERLAQAVCDFEDDSDPEAKRPRRFRNAIFGIAPTPAALDEAVQSTRRLRAAEEVMREQKKGTPLREQVEELLPTFRKRARFQAIRAFNRVTFQGRRSVTLDEKYLVSDESALGSVWGQPQLKSFLDDNKLVYQPNDALDVDLLLELLKGATPSLDHEGAYPAHAVHERVLSSDKVRLMMNENPLRRAILNAVEQGSLVVRLANGEVYDKEGCVSGAEGSRKREEGKRLSTLELTSDVLLAPRSAPCVADWVKVDEGPGLEERLTIAHAAAIKYTTPEAVDAAIAEGQIDYVTESGEQVVVNNERFRQWQPAWSPDSVTATTWDEGMTHAEERPLLKLTLKADSPRGADTLMACAQPFGARSLTLSVKVSGKLKEGGMVNFAANNLKHNSTLKPIDMAKRMLRSTQEDATFLAELVLEFGGAGLMDAASRFEQARTAADDVGLVAEFGKEDE